MKHIRWMIRRDMPRVIEIERVSFEFSWTEDEFIRSLRQRNTIGMVVEEDDVVVGFMIYELHKHYLRMLNLAIDPKFRRRKIGTQMIEKLKSKLSFERRSSITAVVRETNLSAQMFFKKQEFKAVEVIRDLYDDTTEDGYLFDYQFNNSKNIPINRISNLTG